MNTNLQSYYTQRAKYYEEIYQYPERQTELADLTLQLQHWLKNKNVLEVACGTGYWTERYAEKANRVLATDINVDMLAIAKAKQFSKNSDANRVSFQVADAFALPEGEFNVCVAGFWWSHVKRSAQSLFLTGLKNASGSGTVLVMFDNCYVEEGDKVPDTPIARTDLEGNTYQIHHLPDGSRHEILKNFPTDSALRKKISPHARDIRIVRNKYYWMLTCVLR